MFLILGVVRGIPQVNTIPRPPSPVREPKSYGQAPRELSYRERVIVAIDCGSTQSSKSGEGFIWDADTYYSKGSKASDYRENSAYKNLPIKFAEDSWIYKSERHSDDSFAYEVPVYGDEGTYVLILKFSEMYFNRPGARVFHIKLGDYRVVENLDIYKEVGRNAALDIYIEFQISEDEVFYKGNLCSNAFKFRDQVLVVEFEKTTKDLPKVDAIMLFEGNLNQTRHSDYMEKRRKAEAELEAIKQKEKPKPVEVPVEIPKPVPAQEEPPNPLKLMTKGPGLVLLLMIFAIVFLVVNTGRSQDDKKESEDSKHKKKAIKDE